jgi:HSP20 family protein
MVRWDPAREMMSMRQLMDRLMESAFVPTDRWPEGGAGTMEARMDLSETPDAYEVKLAVPGVDPEDLSITYENNTLTVRGEAREEQERQEATQHVREIRYGTFSRSLMLPGNVNADAIEAACENGLLRLRIPKAEEAKPRRIQVRGAQGQLGGGNGQKQQQMQAEQPAEARRRTATKKT